MEVFSLAAKSMVSGLTYEDDEVTNEVPMLIPR